jgi:Ni/Co efflux regulator RcnB
LVRRPDGDFVVYVTDEPPDVGAKYLEMYSMNRRAALSFIACGSAVVVAPPAGAQLPIGQLVFSELERRLILDYYASQSSASSQGRGHGRGHGGALPPGIQRRVDRGGTLPPGIARQYLPQDLSRQLPPVPSGYARQVVGSDVVLVAIATGLVMDVIRGAIRE